MFSDTIENVHSNLKYPECKVDSVGYNHCEH